MYYYRLYYLDKREHHIVDFSEFEAISDAVAIVKAGEPKDGVSRELWTGPRRVLELVR